MTQKHESGMNDKGQSHMIQEKERVTYKIKQDLNNISGLCLLNKKN